MAKKKLSEALAELGITADDLDDDESGLSVAEVKKRMKANQDAYTKGQQTIAERDKALAEYDTAYRGWRQRAEQLEAHSQTLEQRIAERAEKVQAAGGDWKRDPLFQDLVSDFDEITVGIKDSRDAAGALAKGMFAIASRYNEDRKAFLGFADEVQQRFMKMDNPDFDAAEVRKWANENGVQSSWKDSYERFKASKLPETEGRIREEERKKVLDELGDRVKPPVETEMGGGGRSPSGPIGGEKPKDYKNAWDGLAKQFEGAGIGRS